MSRARLALTEEQSWVLFYLFGQTTSSPCPSCGSQWGTSVSRESGRVTSNITHGTGCRYAEYLGLIEPGNEFITEPEPAKKRSKKRKKGKKS